MNLQQRLSTMLQNLSSLMRSLKKNEAKIIFETIVSKNLDNMFQNYLRRNKKSFLKKQTPKKSEVKELLHGQKVKIF